MSPNPVLWALIFGLAVVALILLLSLLMGFFIALASRSYSDKLQKKYQNKIRQLLPGNNCSECGCENCDHYARSVLFGVEPENACPHVSEQTPQKILSLVKEMQALMEDPTPIKHRKKRSFLFRKANK